MYLSTPSIAVTSFSRVWFGSSLFFFLLAATLGCLLRFYWVEEFTEIPYKYFLYAHSHVALLGWAFTLLSGGMLFLMLPPERAKCTSYRWVLAINGVSVLGMSVAFCIQGYGAVSIFFCGLHLVSAYLFSYLFLRDIRQLPASTHRRLAKWAILWVLISTIGLLAIGPVIATFGKIHPLYYASIQFFLHLQLNGWLTLGMLALLVAWLSRRGQSITFPPILFAALQLSVILTYALSVSWSTPLVAVFLLNSIGVLLQLTVFALIARQLFPAIRDVNIKKGYLRNLLWIGLGSLAAKIIIQSTVAIPVMAEVSYTIRNFIVGFVHLTALGSITFTLIAVLVSEGLLPDARSARTGYLLLIVAFLSTEILLFGQGLSIWLGMGYLPNYHEALFGFSVLFPLALLLTMVGFQRQKVLKIHTL